ncbi:hypothetical protein O181_044527 [Austropuccinia psidii MF-1]|uniref:Tet-like 2OG-Fe(II) oxygenase domain-containing protein n=1 Tax=Austropuccinia psidii MF-1 TaxID=1389203 RepID=A0A9Q3DRZ4_9BASI|nr:hypothetical protein [Austropuccinia psidii MF-1]
MAIFSSTGLLIALDELRPFTPMSEVKVNKWEELSQLLFGKRKFTDPVATNGALLEGYIFAIGWCKCNTKNKQFGIYRSLGRIKDAKEELWNQGPNPSWVSCILGPGSHSGIQTHLHSQYPGPSHSNTEACPGSLLFFAHKSSCLSRILMLHTQILTPVQHPNASHANPYACTGSQPFKQLLTPGKGSENSKNNALCLSRYPNLHMQILTLVQVPKNSNNPLCQCRLPTVHKQILMLV